MNRNRVAVTLLLLASALVLISGWLWHTRRSRESPAELKAANERTDGRPLTRSHDEAPQPTNLGVIPKPELQSPITPPAEIPPAKAHDTSLAAEKSSATVVSTNSYPRLVQNVFELQVALARRGIGCGSIDGVMGPQTRLALRCFQRQSGLPPTGELDHNTRACLALNQPVIKRYVVSSNDLACLQPLSPTWLGKSRQTVLAYETLLELVSEKSHSSPALVRLLNPELIWSNVPACATIELPDVTYPQSKSRASGITIYLGQRILEAWDEQTNVLAHFPCSIARQVDKRPVGELHVAVLASHPNYTFDPKNFPESDEARELQAKLVLPPGPNSPVGVAWIGLDKPGYGIHGTARPEQIGRSESHGCFRLTNWDAEYLVQLVSIGTPVYVEP